MTRYRRKTRRLCNLCLAERASSLQKGTLVRVVEVEACDTERVLHEARGMHEDGRSRVRESEIWETVEAKADG